MISLSFKFDSIEAAQEFLRAVNGPKTVIEVRDVPYDPLDHKKERKPRSDAGQPRGPYKRKEESPVEAAAPATVPAETPPAAPEAAAAGVSRPDTGAVAAVLTIADVRAAMTGRSTEKNIALLKKFGYEKSSDLPKDKYADFIAAAKRGE